MEKFSTEYFHKLANDLKFDLSDEEIEELKKDFVAVEEQVSLFEKVDTEGVEPMVYPFEAPTTFLREDVVSDVLTQEEALTNVKDQMDTFSSKKCDYLITVLNDDTVYALIERASGSSECNVISKI